MTMLVHAAVVIPIYQGHDIGELIDELETPLKNGKYIKLNWNNPSALLSPENQVNMVENLIKEDRLELIDSGLTPQFDENILAYYDMINICQASQSIVGAY